MIQQELYISNMARVVVDNLEKGNVHRIDDGKNPAMSQIVKDGGELKPLKLQKRDIKIKGLSMKQSPVFSQIVVSKHKPEPLQSPVKILQQVPKGKSELESEERIKKIRAERSVHQG